ncbi:MAG: nucleotidyl transferase AbiEii/AbiGii toxin family protein [Bifidobacteriaceae bacterium]|jgi:hypothetical protein|nr:nucleotidyl transferase AbiEii/AbiGii toxin family protein [Bifidobacteriaceae bacterium]
MSKVTRGTSAGDAYLDLQNQARRTHRPTDELHQIYALEGFLARLAASPVATKFVLKGGMLLAAFDTRRPTRDVDLEALAIDNDAEVVLGLIRQVLAIPLPDDDGLLFDLASLSAQTIRDEDENGGVRVSATARLATAQLRFHVDVNVGDPIWPEPVRVMVPRLRGGAHIELVGYPLHMVLAEKIVTAAGRGVANTRWRDFADVYALIHQHPVDGSLLHRACVEVATYRNAVLEPLSEVLEGYADVAQGRWLAWRRRHAYDHLPKDFANVLAPVIAFASPALGGEAGNLTWNPESQAWARRAARPT